MKKLLLTVAVLTSVTATNAIALTPQQLLDGVAIMAEYLTSCEDEATPETVRNSLNIIRRADYSHWLATASKYHIVRSEDELDAFCAKVQSAFQKMLKPPDFGPRNASKIKPPPGDLNLNPLARRIP